MAPSFDFGVKPDGYHVWLHPAVLPGEGRRAGHLVLAPILWHFETREDDDTVVFPMWWQFQDLQHEVSRCRWLRRRSARNQCRRTW